MRQYVSITEDQYDRYEKMYEQLADYEAVLQWYAKQRPYLMEGDILRDIGKKARDILSKYGGKDD